MPHILSRRTTIASLGAVALVPDLAAAQGSGGSKRIGVLMPASENDPEVVDFGAVFRQSLEQLGWVGGRNLRVDYRWGGGDERRLATLAAELVAASPDVILAGGAPAVAPLKRATGTIPIVFVSTSDPVGQGFVRDLGHPGGNITGFTNFDPGMGAKWLALLKEIAPNLKHVAVLYNPQTAPYIDLFLGSVVAAAPALGVKAAGAEVHDDDDIDHAMASLTRSGNGGLLVPSDIFTLNHAAAVVNAASQYRLPAIYAYRVFATLGGLVSWGVDLGEQMKLAAKYIDRILRGTAPGDLQVLKPERFVLVINKKTATALGLNLSPALLQRADEVIE
jgi:putative tryptophan/tyrosine transport system substrate-binding protein